MKVAVDLAVLPTLRLLTCGSVDDGKSTLIGRMLYEKKLIFDDQLSTLERDSKKFGTTGEAIDYALLVDGLEAEREQGITIDVAYRYFATERRSFIVADTPGHSAVHARRVHPRGRAGVGAGTVCPVTLRVTTGAVGGGNTASI